MTLTPWQIKTEEGQKVANRTNTRQHSHPGKQRQKEISKQQTRHIRDDIHTLASRDRAGEVSGQKIG